MKKNNILIIIDMQNDFISGVLGSSDKTTLPEKIKTFISEHDDFEMIFTKDTHTQNEKSYELSVLPIHCEKETGGWQIVNELKEYSTESNTIEKSSFMAGSGLSNKIREINSEAELWMCGVCTDICVISNAFMLRREFPKAKINILSELCMGATAKAHDAALEVMRSSLFNII